MIMITIKRNFKAMSMFINFCEDNSGVVSGDTITFPSIENFRSIAKLFPLFFKNGHGRYLTFKNIKTDENKTDDELSQ